MTADRPPVQPRGPAHFRQGDLTKAIKAAERAGKEVLRVEIEPNGRVVIITSRDDPAAEPKVDLAEELRRWRP